MNLTDNKGIKVTVEVDGNIIDTTPESMEKKKGNSFWLILFLAILATFVLFPDSFNTVNDIYNQNTKESK